MSRTIELTEDQFFDYMYCPAYFDMKYIKQLDIEERRTVPKLLEEVSRFFYFQLFSGVVPSPDELKRRWDNISSENKDYITPQRNLEGIGLIMNLFNWAANEKLLVLDVSTPYSFTVQNVMIEGNVPVIMGVGDSSYEILATSFSRRLPDQRYVDMSLKNTIHSYGCSKVLDKKEKGIRVQSVKHNKSVLTQRSEDDYSRLKTAVHSVGNSIINSAFYPREGIECNTCGAKHYCKYWTLGK